MVTNIWREKRIIRGSYNFSDSSSPIALNAWQRGYEVSKIMNSSRSGTVNLINNHQLGILCSNSQYLIVNDRTIPTTPFSIVINNNNLYNCRPKVIKKNTRVELKENCIVFAEGIWQIDIRHACIWFPQINTMKPILKPMWKARQLARIIDEAGISFFVPLTPLLVLSNNITLKQQKHNIEKMERKAISGFVDALKSGNDLASACGGLIGLGPGLTPSGDDMLIGFFSLLCTLDYLEVCFKSNNWSKTRSTNHLRLSKLKTEILKKMTIQTTILSKKLLFHAINDGCPSQVVCEAIQMILGDSTQLRRGVSYLAEYGSTSGYDTLVGIALAFYALSLSF